MSETQVVVCAPKQGDKYATQADGRPLRVDEAECFASPCPGCSNCDTLGEIGR